MPDQVRVAVNGYGVIGKRVADAYQVFNEAIVVPESIDAIRALAGTVTDGPTSIAMTDGALGVRRDFLVPLAEPASVPRS